MTFPPGWARLSTRPVPTGSLLLAMTIGMAGCLDRSAWRAVAALARWLAFVPKVTMASAP